MLFFSRIGGGLKITMVFVGMNIEPGRKKEVIKRLKELEGVEEAYILSGFFDGIAKLVAKDIYEVNAIIQNKIKKIDAIYPLSIMVMEVLEK